MSKYDSVSEKRQTAKPIPVKEWTSTDHLTHDFMNCPGYKKHCLEFYGQYMGHEGRRVTA